MDNPAAPILSILPQPTISAPEKSMSRHWFLWLIVGAVLLGLGIAIGIFSAKFFSQSQSPSQLTLTTTPTLSPIPSPDLYREPDGSAATANWKTYANTSLGIEFKYPSQVLVDQDGNVTIQNGEYSMNILSSTTPGTNLHELNPTNIDQVVSDRCPNWTDMKSCSDSQPGPLPNSVQFDTLNRHYASTETIIQNGNVIYDVSLNAVNPNTPISIKARQVYNQILSTFKFTD